MIDPVIVRPGPDYLEPGCSPEGVVIHVYAVPTNRLILIRAVSSYEEAAVHAEPDAIFVRNQLQYFEFATCLVVFDGDTGERWAPEDWERWEEATTG